MRQPASLTVVAAALVSVVGACGPGRLDLAPPAAGYGPDDYGAVLAAWTRSAEDHHNFMEGRLFVSATYWSPAFRAARRSHAEAVYTWDGPARARAEREDREEASRYYTFFVAISTHDWRWNHLDDPESMWWVWLEDDAGRRVRSTDIRRVRKRRAEYAAFYPYLRSFHEGYIVRFPRQGSASDGEERSGATGSALPRIEEGTRSFSMRVVGAPAAVELEWNL